jgi:hypothetical protein
MHAARTTVAPGATPLLAASSRPKFLGSLPALPACGMPRLWPRDTEQQATLNAKTKDSDYRKERVVMSVLKAPPKQPKTSVVQLRLDGEARSTLTKYAEYLECSPSHVVTEALKLVYRKDKDFQAWLSAQHPKVSEASSKGETFQLELK